MNAPRNNPNVAAILFGVGFALTYGLASVALLFGLTFVSLSAPVVGGVFTVLVAIPLGLYVWTAAILALRQRKAGVLMGMLPAVMTGLWLLWLFMEEAYPDEITRRTLGYLFGNTILILIGIRALRTPSANEQDAGGRHEPQGS